MNRQVLTKWVLFPLFFLTVFFIALYWTFPVHTLKSTVKHQMEGWLNARANPRMGVPASVEIGKVSLWRISGLNLTNITVNEAGSSTRPGAKWEFDSLKVRRGILSLLFGDATYTFDADLYGGGIEGGLSLNAAQEMSSLDLYVHDLDLRRAHGLRQRLGGVEFTGMVNLEMDLNLGKNPAQEGEMHLVADVKNLRVKQFGESPLGDLTTTFVIENGKAVSQPLSVKGEEFEANASVSLDLNNDVWRSTFEGVGSFELKGKRLNIAALLDVDRAAKRAKEGEGKYSFWLQGALNRPRFGYGKNPPSRPTPRNSRLRSLVPN